MNEEKEMVVKKILSGILIFFFINLFINAQKEFTIRGKLVKNGKGFKGIGLRIFPKEKERNHKENFIETLTDENGEFSFSCISGKYIIQHLNDDSENDDLIYIGPDGFEMSYEFVVNDEDMVFKRNFVAYTKLEIIEKSRDILSSISPNLKYVSYKWGKIPIFSLEECKQAAEEDFEWIKSWCGSLHLVKNAHIGDPVVFFDFENNPAFYQFPIMFGFIELSYVGIHAIGSGPRTENLILGFAAETNQEVFAMIKVGKKNKYTLDCNAPAAIEALADKLKCRKRDIHLEKLLYLYGGAEPVYALVKNIKNGNFFILGLYHYGEYLSGPVSLSEYSLSNQMNITFQYIMDCRGKEIPILE
jgi:hypothetical protein